MTATRDLIVGGQAACVRDQGLAHGILHSFHDLLIGGENDPPRSVHVLLPRDYEASSTRHPIVYMNDGHTAFFPGGLVQKHWRVVETLSTNPELDKVIVVAVCPVARDREYTHAHWEQGRAHGGLKTYGAYLAERLKPFIDAHYPTARERERTLVVGSSHGGLAAFFIAATWPERFGVAAAMSPSFWAGLDMDRVLAPKRHLVDSELFAATRATLADVNLRPRLWIDWGLERRGGTHNSVIEMLATYRGEEMTRLLRDELGYTDRELRVLADPTGGHDEDAWARRFPLMLRWFLDGAS